MVVGNGLMASAFNDYRDNNEYLIFASGVSNSKETSPNSFEREKNILLETLLNYDKKKFIYFSTYSILDPSMTDSQYIKHKIQIEEIIKDKSHSYLIFRLSNIVGSLGNRTNIFNYLVDTIEKQMPFDLWQNATRNLLDIDHVKGLIESILNSGIANVTLNITNKKAYTIPEIVKNIEDHLGLKAKFKLVNKGASFQADITPIESIYDNVIDEKSQVNYIRYLLNKYY